MEPWPTSACNLLDIIHVYQEEANSHDDHGKDDAGDDIQGYTEVVAEGDAEVDDDHEARAQDGAEVDAEQGELHACRYGRDDDGQDHGKDGAEDDAEDDAEQGARRERRDDTVLLNRELLRELAEQLFWVIAYIDIHNFENLYNRLRTCKLEVEGLGEGFHAALRDPPAGESMNDWIDQFRWYLKQGFAPTGVPRSWPVKTQAQMAQVIQNEADSILLDKLDEELVAQVWLAVT